MNGLSIETVLLQIFVLFLFAQVAGMVCERLKVPSVIGEIFAGIIIANTILFNGSAWTWTSDCSRYWPSLV